MTIVNVGIYGSNSSKITYAAATSNKNSPNQKDYNGMSELVDQLKNGEVTMVYNTNCFGVENSVVYEFVNNTGEVVAKAVEIPNTGHYNYAVYNREGKYLGYIRTLIGYHFFNVRNEEIALTEGQGNRANNGFPIPDGVQVIYNFTDERRNSGACNIYQLPTQDEPQPLPDHFEIPRSYN